jgi:hypothetical protein
MKYLILPFFMTTLAFATSNAPVECSKKAASLGFSRPIDLVLCAGAVDSENPIQCFNNAQAKGLDRATSIEICMGARDPNGPVQCALAAKLRSLPSAQIHLLCKKTDSTAPIDCLDDAGRAGIQLNLAYIVCQGAVSN